jgi:pyruvate dehydrogenase E1 component alpha subunit
VAAARRAADEVRRDGGPRFLELRTYRFRAHSMYDPDRYRAKDEVERWKQRDPIVSFVNLLREGRVIDDQDVARLERAAAAEIDDAVRAAEAGPLEPVEDLTRDVLTREVP